MTDVQYGMNFAKQGGNAIQSPTYSSLQARLQIDLNNPAPLFDVVTMAAGTAININEAVVETISEQLLVVDHNLGYIPQAYLFFQAQLTYSLGFYIISGGELVNDSVGYILTPTTLTINHTVESFGNGTGSYTSTAASIQLNVKYLICNNLGIQTLSFN